MIRIKVFDRDTGKLFWQEDHKHENADRVINELMERTFNTEYFWFEKEEV